jgi:L-ascorbate metabolism protein UlaG (beta-lactamase superfamily)
MIITWSELSFFKIKEKDFSLWIDPLDRKTYDLKSSNSTPNICLLSSPNSLKYDKQVLKTSDYVFKNPGEYEAKDIGIYIGSSLGEKKNINNTFAINWNDINIVHLGAIKEKTSLGKFLEKISNVDVLMIPVGGKSVLSASDAVELVHRIEPSIVIPMFYKTKETGNIDIDDASYFIQEMGQQEKEELDKLKITANNFSDKEKTRVVILTPYQNK